MSDGEQTKAHPGPRLEAITTKEYFAVTTTTSVITGTWQVSTTMAHFHFT